MTSGTGTCSVKYDQAGNANYNAAPQVTESVNAQKADQTITVTTHAPASAAFNQQFTVAATGGGSGNAVAFSSAACVLEQRRDVHDHERHWHLLGQVRPGRRRELQRRAAGDRDRVGREDGPDDHGHHARAGERRLQHAVHGGGDRRRLGQPGHLLEQRRLLEHRRARSR